MPSAFPTKKLSKRTRSYLFGSGLIAITVLGLIPVGNPGRSGSLGPVVAEAQNFGQRILQGKVIGEGDSPVGGATVFLKNLKSRDIKSFTSIPDGSFRFAQVGMVDDYEVWAEQGKKKSAVKTISSFDSRKLVEFDLKLK
ncbi:carboxypeptidase-like regulatory domain-containing protein [Acidicapsa acidisoli]|uniref:carboxypeptidase-like regulatory domain-containing protein n=1 Tax=Acidicapsa acidisoli TaxID=1615681 RepID=UPI0021E0A84F|nr:carboxypeptidase-like regulatory domain-containing protein [Acidicapsa acidisoli]